MLRLERVDDLVGGNRHRVAGLVVPDRRIVDLLVYLAHAGSLLDLAGQHERRSDFHVPQVLRLHPRTSYQKMHRLALTYPQPSGWTTDAVFFERAGRSF